MPPFAKHLSAFSLGTKVTFSSLESFKTFVLLCVNMANVLQHSNNGFYRHVIN